MATTGSGRLGNILNKIVFNGIDDSYSTYEKEKLTTINSFLFICVIVSAAFLLLGLIDQLPYLALLSITYFSFFLLAYLGITFRKLDVMRYSTLFVTNFSVISITALLGYSCGFYFYFFITPLSIHIIMEEKRTIVKALSLGTYIANAALMHYIFYIRQTPPLESINENIQTGLFYFNLLLSFSFCLLLLRYFLNRIISKSEEARILLENKLVLESEIHLKQLIEIKNTYQIEKLKNENEQLDVFSHIISHNLRGPISRVAGLVELIKEYNNLDDEQSAIMGHIRKSVQKMDDIIHDLNYILVQKKLGHQSYTEFSPQDLVSDVLHALEKEINSSNAKIEMEIGKESVKNNYAILHSILYNLLSNSIKYSKTGIPPEIKIKIQQVDQNISIFIKDSGIGIDLAKHQRKLFQLYSRLYDHVEGKGIGLYLVKNHVDLLGGKIEVVSEYMKGAEFTITLPIEN